jgi:hypothetical protein
MRTVYRIPVYPLRKSQFERSLVACLVRRPRSSPAGQPARAPRAPRRGRPGTGGRQLVGEAARRGLASPAGKPDDVLAVLAFGPDLLMLTGLLRGRMLFFVDAHDYMSHSGCCYVDAHGRLKGKRVGEL